MQAHINYEAHLRLKNEVEEYLAKGGKINQVKTIHLNGVENASEHQVKEINDWVGKSSSKFKMLQKRVNKKIKNQPTNWLQNTLKGRKKLPLPMYEIILEEMY